MRSQDVLDTDRPFNQAALGLRMAGGTLSRQRQPAMGSTRSVWVIRGGGLGLGVSNGSRDQGVFLIQRIADGCRIEIQLSSATGEPRAPGACQAPEMAL